MEMELFISLLHNPGILFLDEPITGLGAIALKQICSFLKEINKQKSTTVILTSLYGIYKVFFYTILPYEVLAILPGQSITMKMGWQAGIYRIFITTQVHSKGDLRNGYRKTDRI